MKNESSLEDVHPQAREGFQLYDQGEYYLAHEPLEHAWMETESPERKLYQGILQIGLAYFQIKRENYRGALKMFKRGNKNLTPLPDSFFGINIRKLQDDARYVESRLRELGSEQIANLPPELFKPLPYTGQENRL